MAYWRSQDIDINIGDVHATSSGAIVALVLACFPDGPYEKWQSILTFVYTSIKKKGIIESPTIFEELLRTHFPMNAYIMASGRIHIDYFTMTCYGKVRHVRQSVFTSNDDLLRALLKSSAIPGITRRGLYVKDVCMYMDSVIVPHVSHDPHTVRVVSGVDNFSACLCPNPTEFMLPELPDCMRTIPTDGSTIYTQRRYYWLQRYQQYWYAPLAATALWLVWRAGMERVVELLFPWLTPVLTSMILREILVRRRPRMLFVLFLVGYGQPMSRILSQYR